MNEMAIYTQREVEFMVDSAVTQAKRMEHKAELTAERERCRELLAEQRKISHEAMEAYAKAERAAERERCVKIAELYEGMTGPGLIAAIRRGEP